MTDSNRAIAANSLEGGAVTSVELMQELIARLRSISDVIGREHKWLQSNVDHSRRIDDAAIAYRLEHGHIDQAEADERRSEDELILQRSQVDLHLTNLFRGADAAADIAATIEDLFLGSSLIVNTSLQLVRKESVVENG